MADRKQKCNKCKRYKLLSSFSKAETCTNGVRKVCKACRRKEAKSYYKANKSRFQIHWESNRLKRYGLTDRELDTLTKRQNNLCAICKRKNMKNGKEIKLAIDHNHITGKVRGLLCDRCNRAIGQFEDRLDLLSNATKYLEYHERH